MGGRRSAIRGDHSYRPDPDAGRSTRTAARPASAGTPAAIAQEQGEQGQRRQRALDPDRQLSRRAVGNHHREHRACNKLGEWAQRAVGHSRCRRAVRLPPGSPRIKFAARPAVSSEHRLRRRSDRFRETAATTSIRSRWSARKVIATASRPTTIPDRLTITANHIKGGASALGQESSSSSGRGDPAQRRQVEDMRFKTSTVRKAARSPSADRRLQLELGDIQRLPG